MSRPRVLIACLPLLALALATGANAQAVYTWKDAKGVTHYSDSPPPKDSATATLRKVKTTTPVKAEIAATGKEADKANVNAAANARCTQARANLAALEGSAPVGPDLDGDGKPDSTFSAEDRARQAAAMRATLQADCGG